MNAKTIDKDKLPYRPCVGIMLINHNSEVFVGRRIDMRCEAWQMPQGGIDEGESTTDAALRELFEEVGTDNVKVITESSEWHHYDIPDELIPKLWGGKYRGQKQKWFLMQFLGDDSEINIETDIPEFMDWQWLSMDLVPEYIVPFKRKLYRNVVAEFLPMIAKNATEQDFDAS